MFSFEASSRRINRMIGLGAILLPVSLIAIWALGQLEATTHAHICFHDSISEFYYSRIGGDVFVGLLFGMSMMLMSFVPLARPAQLAEIAETADRPGAEVWHRAAVTFAGACMMAVALLPAGITEFGCTEAAGDGDIQRHVRLFAAINAEQIPATATDHAVSLWSTLGFTQGSWVESLHFIAAGLLFATLIGVVWVIFRAETVLHPGKVAPQLTHFPSAVPPWALRQFSPEKILRNRIYTICAIIMALCSTVLLLMRDPETAKQFASWNGVFWFETGALVAFGIAWLVKGRFIAVLR